MNGPKGMGLPFWTIPTFMPRPPMAAPNNVARKNESKTSFTPKAMPITAYSLISHPPMPPLLITAISSRRKKPSPAPAKLSHHGERGMKMRSAIKTAAKNSKTLSGIIIYLKSDTNTIITREISVQSTNNSAVQPIIIGAAANKIPVESSTAGYKAETGALQRRHFPPRNIYDKTGTSSKGDRVCLQCGQWDRGIEID